MVDALTKTEESNKIIIVAIPADRSPLLRMRGANRCTAIAEYFREKGKNVLLNGFTHKSSTCKERDWFSSR